MTDPIKAMAELQPFEYYVQGDRYQVIRIPRGSNFIGDQVIIAECAIGPNAMQVAHLVREACIRTHADMLDRLASQREDVIDREAIIEAVKAKIDARMNDRLIDLKPEMDDSITGFNDAWAVVDTAIRSLTAQPRSNSVEDGAGRNSIQIESSSDTESANAKSEI